MKTASKYNRSQIMKMAWANWKRKAYKTFSLCLKKAWAYAKLNAKMTEMQNKSKSRSTSDLSFSNSMKEYYNRPVGSYYGD